jgi:hypothetical protein
MMITMSYEEVFLESKSMIICQSTLQKVVGDPNSFTAKVKNTPRNYLFIYI